MAQSKDHILVLSGAVFATSGLFFIGCSFNNYRTESHWLAPLFALPLAVQLIGLVALYSKPRELTGVRSFHWFYLGTMSLSEISHCGLWYAYLSGWKNSPELSYVALVAIILLVGLVVVTTIAVMRSDEGSNSPNRLMNGLLARFAHLKTGVSEEPFLALLLFFTVFLVVSYLFGFAFAFHDKSQNSARPALYSRNLYQPIDEKQAEGPKDIHKFLFQEAKAVPEIEDNEPQHQQKGTVTREVAERRKKNHDALKGIIQEIEARTKNDNRIRIMLIGHSDEKPTKGAAYQSNYELAEARARNVESCIIKRLSEDTSAWRNIEWLCFSSSNESKPRSLSEINNDRGRDSKVVGANRLVEVSIEPISEEPTSMQMNHLEADHSKPLSLMDYVYFANYTITTTGYGDIIPTTTYAKFLCSLSNICEVFFLVVFFNALLSLKRAANSDQVKDEAPGGPRTDETTQDNPTPTGRLYRGRGERQPKQESPFLD